MNWPPGSFKLSEFSSHAIEGLRSPFLGDCWQGLFSASRGYLCSLVQSSLSQFPKSATVGGVLHMLQISLTSSSASFLFYLLLPYLSDSLAFLFCF